MINKTYTEFETMKLITYGLGSSLHIDFIQPVENTISLRKPKGGLWASPIKALYGWAEWCRENEMGNLNSSFEFGIKGNILKIDSLADMNKLIFFNDAEQTFSGMKIDFESMYEMKVDAIHLTDRGQKETEYTSPYSMYGWDCESVLVLNPNCITIGEKDV